MAGVEAFRTQATNNNLSVLQGVIPYLAQIVYQTFDAGAARVFLFSPGALTPGLMGRE